MHIVKGMLIAAVAAALSAGCTTSPARTARPVPSTVGAAGATQAISRGEAALREGDAGRAMIEYAAAAELDPRNVVARYRIGSLYEHAGDYGSAAKAYEDVLKIDPAHAGASEGLGLIRLREQNYEQARSYLVLATMNDRHRWRAHNGLGVLDDLAGNYADARAHYGAAIAQHPGDPMLYNNRGYSLYLAGQHRQAEADFQRALQLDARYALAWANLALVRMRLGDYAGSVEAFSETLQPPQAYNNVGYLLYLQGDLDPARRYLERAVALSPVYYDVAHQNLERVAAAAAATRSR